MTINPVFIHELRQSPLRRKPIQAALCWIFLCGLFLWLTLFIPSVSLSWLPLVGLPLLVPGFASGVFAKEYELQTWQDLYLTRLTNAQVVLGKFAAALLQVWIGIMALFPAMILMLSRLHFYASVSTGDILRSDDMDIWDLQAGLAATAGEGAKLLLSACLYVLLAMVCSRYSSNRRTALVWSYLALSLYAFLGAFIWLVLASYVGNPGYRLASAAIAPGFMEGIHLIFCVVVGIGSAILLWVSLSEQRGYRSGPTAEPKRVWQPIAHSRSSNVRV